MWRQPGRRWFFTSAFVTAGIVVLLGTTAFAATEFEFKATPRVRPHATTFLAFGYDSLTAAEEMSLRDGRPLGVAVRLIGPAAKETLISGTFRAPDGALWLTAATGPAASGTAEPHTCPAGGCPTKPDSCTGVVVRIGSRRDPDAETVFRADPSVLISSATPSKTNRQLAYVQQGCGYSGFSEYVVARDLRSGQTWTIGEDAECHLGVGEPSWSADGSKLLFTYSPSGRLSSGEPSPPQGTCQQSLPPEIAIVPAHRDQPVIPAQDLTAASKGCGYYSASYDPQGVIAIEVCGPIDPGHDRAYLVQLNRHLRPVREVSLAPRPDGTSLSASRTGEILISEYQAPKYKTPSASGPPPPPLAGPQVDVWTYNHHKLRLIHIYKQHVSVSASW